MSLAAELAVAEREYEHAVVAIRLAGERLMLLKARIAASEPDDLQLFGRGDYVEHRDLVPDLGIVEYATLPQAAVRERAHSLTLSFDTTEDRERLVDLLEVRVAPGARWSCAWPYEADEFAFDLEGAA